MTPITSATNGNRRRRGGHLLVECLAALGTETIFGLPGTHALAIFDGLRKSNMRFVGLRTELNAGFAADGHARVTGKPTPVIVSTGPGVLILLAALMEADRASSPVVAIASQIPTEFLGRGRGYVHELRDQLASVRPIVKWAERVRSVETIPAMIEQAYRIAATAPAGPVFLEIPQDILNGETELPCLAHLDATPFPPRLPADELVDTAATLLNDSKKPVVWAGGGVVRGGAWHILREVAEKLDAPVVTTQLGKGSLPDDHPLLVGSSHEDQAYQDVINDADAVLVVGTGLAMESSGYYKIKPGCRITHIDAAPERIGATYASLALVGDASATLARLSDRLNQHAVGDGANRAHSARIRIEDGLKKQGRDKERDALRIIRDALPLDAVHSWDLTILGYWAAAHFPAGAPRTFLHAQGSASLGFGLPAAIGAALGRPDQQVLCVAGDGGIMYGISEFATMRQLGLPVKLVVVDDGGYGILRGYQMESYSETFAVQLARPDFHALATSFGISAFKATPANLKEVLGACMEKEGPAVLHLEFPDIRMYLPTT